MENPARLYDDATALLRSLSGSHGIRASTSSSANYGAVFTRDAVMAGVAGLLAGDADITAGFTSTLEHLRTLQGPQGQVASNYLLRSGEPTKVSFGTIVPRLDAPLWYLIGIALGARAGVLDAERYRASAGQVVVLMEALEFNGRHLVYVPAGGDWADEYIYEGYVLHDQVLRAWAMRLAGDTWSVREWTDKSRAIDHAIERTFWPADAVERGYPLAAVTPTRTYDMFDLATCALLGVSSVAPHVAADALDGIHARYLRGGTLPPAFAPVIGEGDPDWPALSRYHLHGFRNRPHEYHNGGVWMIWLGWLALALAHTGRSAAVDVLRATTEAQLARGDWNFEEFLHGRTGEAGGTPGMAYSAAGLLFLRAAARGERLTLLDT